MFLELFPRCVLIVGRILQVRLLLATQQAGSSLMQKQCVALWCLREETLFSQKLAQACVGVP